MVVPMNNKTRYLLFALSVFLLAGCSTTKYVPNGAYLLDDVKIKTDNKNVKSSSLDPYLRQRPNSKWFSLVKTPLYIYNWSGSDSTRWVNRTLRRIGDAPVIYDDKLTQRSEEEITKAVQNMGYISATVNRDVQTKNKKLKLTYHVKTGDPYIVRNLNRDISDARIAEYLQKDSVNTLLKEGMLLDVNVLDAERQRITSYLTRNGYYKFNKEFISYTADTVLNTFQVDLTLHVLPYKINPGDSATNHSQYRINKVSFITNYDIMQSNTANLFDINDSLHYKGFPIYFKDRLYIRPKTLIDNLRITPGSLYNERDVQQTYNYFGRLSALKYTNVRFAERQVGDSTVLNAYVLLTKTKPQSVTFEVEGTNSAGDLGAAASVTYQHRNFFHGSERFSLKFRGAYEALSGFMKDYNYDKYTELGVETSINFPNFMFPFLTSNFKRNIRATTEFNLQYNYQRRPEFWRSVASGSWSYRWTQRQRANHRFDLLDVNFLYMPWISEKFKNEFLEEGGKNEYSILRYNYKDRLIVRMGYTYNYNSIGSGLLNNTIAANSYTIRAGIESAGNLLYALSSAMNLNKNEDNEYTLLNIPYAQYIKADLDFAKNIVIDGRNSIAFHIGGGVAIPYGNAKYVPFEKQYFSGGANSVRGWSVRSLGPGAFPGDGNFMNQSGDIKLDASIEYRTKLFWLLQGAVFVDAGNIWTVRNYDNQPGGQFKFDSFYKQIAVAYGLGIRFDFDFFVLRIDGGMKAINPKSGTVSRKEKYPIISPKFGRDFALHFAVGYPF